MFEVAISELTCPRWELAEEVAHAIEAGFDAIALWRLKVADLGTSATAKCLADAGVAVSSLQWAGGFTGGDGRSFAESIADARDAIATAECLQAPVLVVHSGCRGGHTRSHANRLLWQALESLAPEAAAAGVTLAVRPVHPLAAPDCSFVTRLADAVDLVEQFDDPAIRLAVDLWHFGADDLGPLLPRLAAGAALVQVADRVGPPASGADRLPAGDGELPLERLVAGLVAAGYRGVFEFDPVGEAVEAGGYQATWRRTHELVVDWAARMTSTRTRVSGPAPRQPAHLRSAAAAGAAG